MKADMAVVNGTPVQNTTFVKASIVSFIRARNVTFVDRNVNYMSYPYTLPDMQYEHLGCQTNRLDLKRCAFPGEIS